MRREVLAALVSALLLQISSAAPAPTGSSSSSSSGSSSKPRDQCVCPKILKPVCWKGVEYPNSCIAECFGRKGAKPGACKRPTSSSSSSSGSSSSGGGDGRFKPLVLPAATPKPKQNGRVCTCPLIDAPVCGVDKNTYYNECTAKCRGVRVASAGVCGSPVRDQPGDFTLLCICPSVVDPVCGKDNKTYVNTCAAACGKTTAAYGGECSAQGGAGKTKPVGSVPQLGPQPSSAPVCKCPLNWDPVCASNGRTYGNGCQAECEGNKVVSKGYCKQAAPTLCPTILRPVCGVNGVTYDNDCLAKRAGTQVSSQGPCGGSVPPCPPVCPTLYAPVCGVNGVSYDNACQAACARTPVASQGACEKRAAAVASVAPAQTSSSTPSAKPGSTSRSPAPKPAAVPKPPAGKAAATPTPRRKTGCFCTAVFMPVCGNNGVTYPNRCEASCEQVAVAYVGDCSGSSTPGARPSTGTGPRPAVPATVAAAPKTGPGSAVSQSMTRPERVCNCSDDISLVCGKNGKTYRNECLLKCADAELARKGPCAAGTDAPDAADVRPPQGSGCACPLVYMPVCGADGKTYGNGCAAGCAAVKVAAQGPCGGGGSGPPK